MKKVFAVIMAMLLAFGMCFNTLAEPEITGPSVNGSVTVGETSEEGGQENVPFGDSYYGFCLDQYLKPAHQGDVYTSVQPIEVKSNVGDKEDISGLLKILVVEYFDEFFLGDEEDDYFNGGTYFYYEPDENGNFKLNANKVGLMQNVIWNLTDGLVLSDVPATAARVTEIVKDIKGKAADPKRIPVDRGHSITRKLAVPNPYGPGSTIETRNIYFDFWVMRPAGNGQQDFFAFKASMTPFSKNPPVNPNPNNPNNPGANDGFEGNKTELPQTGDAANLTLWIGMLAVSAWGMIAFARRKRVSR